MQKPNRTLLDNTINSNKKKSIVVLMLFIFIGFLLLRKIIFSHGLIIGSDWGYPVTQNQVNNFSKIGFYSWTQTTLLGFRTISLNIMPQQIIILLASYFKINGEIYVKCFLLFLYVFAGFSVYNLLKFFQLNDIPSIVGGCFYITTPVFFNYTIMGWGFVLLAMGLLPLAVKYFIKAVKEDNIKYTIITGLIYAISVIQSQSVVWFMIVFMLLGLYLINNKKSLKIYIKNLIIVMIIFFAINSYWVLGILLAPEKGVSGSDMVYSAISMGTVAYFNLTNIFCLFGSLFNYQYETVVHKFGLRFIYFIIPMFVVVSGLLYSKKKLILTMMLIALIPCFMHSLNKFRDLLQYIPYSNLIRDFPRFMILSAFAYAVLIGIVLNYLLRGNSKLQKIGFLLIFILFISIFPWWSGELTNWQKGSTPDNRLRTKVFPDDYFNLEYKLCNKKLNQKAIYFPLGGILFYNDDPKFWGSFHQASDIFAAYSSISGPIYISDRNLGYGDQFMNKIVKNNSSKEGIVNLFQLYNLTNIKLFIIRKHALKEPSIENKDLIIEMLKSLLLKNGFKIFYKSQNISAYSRNNFVPQLYIPKQIIYFDGEINDILSASYQEKLDFPYAIIDKKQNEKNNSKKFIESKDFNFSLNNPDIPTLEFKKINLTKYRIIVHKAKKSFPLVFSESFHDQWKLYIKKNKEDDINLKLDNYKVLDENENVQATFKELSDFVLNGYVTSLGNNKEKTIKHQKRENGITYLDYEEKYYIDFISKNYYGTIQNNNLNDGNFYDIFITKSLSNNENHFVCNGYANGWWIDVDEIKESGLYLQNPDGSIDFEIVVEFSIQQYFYIGVFICVLTLFICALTLLICIVIGDKGQVKRI